MRLASWPVLAALALAAPARADTSKLAKEDVPIQPKAILRGKNKACCGYPLSKDLGYELTFYWLAFEDDFQDPSSGPSAGTRKSPVRPDWWVDLYTREGFFFGRVPERFAWSLRMEGSGVMMDGRIVGYYGSCNFGYGTCFQTLDPVQFPFARGAGQRPLLPFKSVAVDPRYISLGEPLYFPELDGIALPDGSIHDGCVRADDVGGAIKKRHIDFFVVTFASYRMLIEQLLGVGFVTPHVQAPRCEYLRLR